MSDTRANICSGSTDPSTSGVAPRVDGVSRRQDSGKSAAAALAARLAHGLARRTAGQPAILLACLLPALWLVAALFLQHVRDKTLEDAGTETSNLARVMAEEA